MRAILALEDGRHFIGESFGAEECAVGEVCFNTSMTGYQEVLTDPSYRGQIVAMTYPLIGNYGVNTEDEESAQPHVRGFIIEELSPVPSNWRSRGTLEDYLRKWTIPGIQGIDTRALTRHLRDKGAMKGALCAGEISVDEAVRRAQTGDGVIGMDYVKEVTPHAPFDWDPEDTLSRQWTIVKGGEARAAIDPASPEQFEDLPPTRHKIVAYDFGMKRNILRRLR
ncbi:MAG TPA: carbamoyl-phosphate synthase domain-containing protein, partial [Chthoniobacteraceae bacterium]|nr:carbamoyl-phosphate synthase domain-containing protein [Chthoniobacteraceae bacterium]